VEVSIGPLKGMFDRKHFIVTCMSEHRRGLDWWMDLLTTHTHDLERQAIRKLPGFFLKVVVVVVGGVSSEGLLI
jgi:hypothetical protein